MKISFIILLLFIGCSHKTGVDQSSFTNNSELQKIDGKYDSFYPTEEVSSYLEEMVLSVKIINSIAFYEVYLFDYEKRIFRDRIDEAVNQKYYYKKTDFTNTASGSATIIFQENKKIGLVTCAHIVDMQDTIFTYFREKDGTSTNYVESFSVKKSQSNYVVEFSGSGSVDLIASDKEKDIAYLGKEYSDAAILPFKTFNFKTGNAKELNWGTFTYVIGYPLNFRMVSRAIVSSPNRSSDGSFLLDAVFNRGMSGGIIVALRDGVPNFEMVGMVHSVPGDKEFILVPPKNKNAIEYNNIVPYKGELFVEEFRNLKYGITRVVSINSIKEFFIENKEYLFSKGFYPATFLEP